jgi:lysophospholipase L1-like esterase
VGQIDIDAARSLLKRMLPNWAAAASVLLLTGCATHKLELPSTTTVQAPFLFEREISAFEAADAVRRPASCQILFVGASSIRLWSTLAQDMGRLTLDRGFGGSRIPDVNRVFARVVAPYRPRAIVFYAGENDIALGATPEDVAAQFDLFMKMKRDTLRATPVYFISIKPSPSRIAQLESQALANALIRARADVHADLVFVDVADAMMAEGVPRDIFRPDRLHMNAAGYAIWTGIVKAALDKPFPTRAPGCR